MPANLPPQYFEAEKAFREAKTAPEKIAALEEMLAIMPHHKGTDHLRAELRRRIAKLSQIAGQKAGGQRASTVIPKEGAAQVVITGPPNVGKSQLVSTVTNAKPAVGDYPFTTQTATPGMMEFENIKIQLIDTPPLVPGGTEFWMTGILRRADALMVMVDLTGDPLTEVDAIAVELKRLRIIIISEGTEANSSVPVQHKKAMVVGNKIDMPGATLNFGDLRELYEQYVPVVAISARQGTGIEEMKQKLYKLLDIIRVYTKPPGGKPDFTDPVVVRRGSKLEDAAAAVHKDFAARLRYARLWGSGRPDGIMVKRDYILQDGDIIELHV